MKTHFNYIIIILIMILSSCETPDDIKKDIELLQNKRTVLQGETYLLQTGVIELCNKADSLTQDLKVLKLIESGKQPKYVLKLKLKQSHFTLDIDQHLKDAVNAIEFELPVDKEFYNAVKIDTELMDEFRVGSMIFKGSYGKWTMIVIDKEIR